MCILFLYTGDTHHPTIICNNRDEYYARPTVRGVLSSHSLGDEEECFYSYTPKDLQGGGSWLNFDNLHHPTNNLRYAIVLNYHHWRELSIFGFISHLFQDMNALKSRGKLVSNFLKNQNISAKDYADQIFHERHSYRPFNLIVSDHFNETYYISSSPKQTSVRKLNAGQLYGVSNGYMEDPWDKVVIGKSRVMELLHEYLPKINIPALKDWNRNLEDTSDSFQREENLRLQQRNVSIQQNVDTDAVTNFATLNELISHLKTIMTDNTPLPDVTLGSNSLAVMQLAAIFVNPTQILKDEHRSFRARLLEDKYRIISPDSSGDDKKEIDITEIFGTRTVTIFIYYHRESLLTADTSATTITGPIQTSAATSGLFTIVETDYMIDETNAYQLTKSSNVYTNV